MARWRPLVVIDAGPVYYWSTMSCQITYSAESTVKQFVGALADVSLPAEGEDNAQVEIVVPREVFDAQDARASGVVLGGAKAEVSLWREGDDYAARWVLLVGRVVPNSERRSRDRTAYSIAAFEQSCERTFPPAVILADDFASISDGEIGKALNVVYGLAHDVPLTPTCSLGVNDTTLRFLVAGHRLATSSIEVKPSGVDADSFWATVAYGHAATTGSTYAYVDLTGDQSRGPSTFVADVAGHPDSNGVAITGLGDVIDHAIRVYGRFDADRIDEVRLSVMRHRANAIQVGSCFGGNPGPSVVQTLQSRFSGETFPVQVSWQNGKVGADYLAFDQFARPVRKLRYRAELLKRAEPIGLQSDVEQANEFRVEYDRATVTSLFRGYASRDWMTDARCARAYSRFGKVTYQPLQVPDVIDGSGAQAILEWLVQRHAVVRTQVTYLSTIDTMRWLPRLERYDLTDDEMGWTDEPFRLETKRPMLDGTCECTFLSIADEAP